MDNNDASVRFLYGTAFGRLCLQCILSLKLDRLAVGFLRSPLSRPYLKHYAKRHGIAWQTIQAFPTFRDYFARERETTCIDENPGHVVSPCDGYLSVYEISRQCVLSIKGSFYRIHDLLPDREAENRFQGGLCLVFRLCAMDYHHYIYIDDGYQSANHFIEGSLYSVQPIACETYPVLAQNRRSWCILETQNLGRVADIEIGAFIVGGIVNHKENDRFKRGEEKGRFELAGSTIVLLFEADRIALLESYAKGVNTGKETRVTLGQCIGERIHA